MGIKKARVVLVSGHQYTSQDQENMEQFFLQHASSKRVKNEAWLEGEDFLPEGWKYKINTGPNGDYSKLLSPQGEAFNKAGALSHMILFGYPQDQVDKMHASLVYDGWEKSSLLPKDWMYRKCKSGRNEYNFLTHMGELFPSKVTLVSYMTKQGIYTDQDIQNVGVLRKELKAKWISGHEDWVDNDPSVPKGWRLRYQEGRGRLGQARTRCYILSPEGGIFQTRLKALQHLLLQQPRDTDLVQVK